VSCHATVTNVYGVRGEPRFAHETVDGVARGIGVRGFRAFCAGCGYLGRLHVNFFSCERDAEQHNRRRG
jgi:hypothetical protein